MFSFFGAATAKDGALDDIFAKSKTEAALAPAVSANNEAKKPKGVKASKKVVSRNDDGNDMDVDVTVENEEDSDSNEEFGGEVETKGGNNAKGSIKKRVAAKDDHAKNKRSIFIGNLPVKAVEKAVSKRLLALFKPFGAIESLRFRSIAFSSVMPRKASFLAKSFHPERDAMNAYLVFKNEESVEKALSVNGQVFDGKHIRVDKAIKSESTDFKRSVFLGNLAFDISDEALWDHFKDCGEIQNIRVVRDKKTNIGKGFGYVQFAERHAVQVALQMDGHEMDGRKMRVTKCEKATAPLKRILSKGKPKKEAPKKAAIKVGGGAMKPPSKFMKAGLKAKARK
ncbi:hypothetical protein BC830DRAFT_1134385 [Chytriomyces sp. MP71]|nr:hypothetical protein BC830DRAFT_1134385 [Chytriomyces sp. MP71]